MNSDQNFHRNNGKEGNPNDFITSSDIENQGETFFNVDKFLHEPTRLQIIVQLYSLDQADMIYLKNALGLTWGNLSFHAIQLEEKHYITISKEFIGKKPYTLLKITPEGKQKFEEYRASIIKFLTK